MRIRIALLALSLSRLAASADPAPAPPARLSTAAGPPIVVQVLPLPLDRRWGFPPDLNEGPAQLCKLGTSCLTLDPRPFETCLLGTTRCPEKMASVRMVVRELRAPR